MNNVSGPGGAPQDTAHSKSLLLNQADTNVGLASASGEVEGKRELPALRALSTKGYHRHSDD